MNALPTWIRVPDAGAASDEAPFLDARRREARAVLETRGLPTRKTEAFRFTSVRDLVETDFADAAGDADADVAAVQRRLGGDDTYRVVIADGHPLLTGETRDGVLVMTLAEATATHADALEATLAKLVPSRDFAAANTASFDEAVVIVVPPAVDAAVPVHLVHVVTDIGRASFAHPRVVVLVGAKSRATLVESYLGDASGVSFLNAVVEIRLEEGAELQHLVAGEAPGSTIAAIGVAVGPSARYVCRSTLFGGKLARFDHHVDLAGPSAHADLAGVLFARGTDHVDHHVHVDHTGPKGTSTQRFRGIADEHGTVVYDGIVNVRATAPGCTVEQESKNLLLSADAAVYAKPHLEIDVDEVVASHGTTVGSFDRDQLFYMRARGVDANEARAMLTHAFVRAILDDVSVAAVRDRLTSTLLSRLPNADLAATDSSDATDSTDASGESTEEA